MGNNTQMGGATPHNEGIAKAIVRSSGDATAKAFEGTRTASPHLPSDGAENWPYKTVPGEGWGGNVQR